MLFSSEQIFIIVGFLLLVSVLASKLSNKFGIPALLLFLLIGILAGHEGIVGIEFDDPNLIRFIGDIGLTLILFAGGLDTEWKKIRPILGQGLLLSTLGVIITMFLVGSFSWFILGSFSNFDVGNQGIVWLEGLLLGAIVSSTDAAAVFSVLKSSNLSLKGNIQPLLELESGSNDPMAVLLTTQLVHILVTSDLSITSLILALMVQIIVGIICGYGSGLIMVWITNHLRLISQGLYPVATLALLLLSYGVTTSINGNGFLAVYIAGVVFRNHNISHRNTIVSFHDGLSWLMQIIMFLTLGLFVIPSQLLPVAGVSLAIAFFLIFIARPLSVFISLAFTKYQVKEKLFISWVGLRGSVPIILATFPIVKGIEDAEQIFNLVFFLVITSVFIQGLSLAPMANFLGVTVNKN